MKIRLLTLSICLIVSFSTAAFSEENFDDILKRAQELKSAGKYNQALEELSWASKQLAQLHAKKLHSFFPEDVEGFKAQEPKSNSSLGIIAVERTYEMKGGPKIKVALTGGSGSTASEGIGNIARMAQMAAMMDPNAESETIRIHGQRAIVRKTNREHSLSMTLPGGMLLKIERRRGEATQEQLEALANGFDIPELEKYLAQ